MFRVNDVCIMLPSAPYGITRSGCSVVVVEMGCDRYINVRLFEGTETFSVLRSFLRLATVVELAAIERYGEPAHRIETPIVISSVNRLPGGFTLGWELEACTKVSSSEDERNVPDYVEECEDGSVNGDGMEYRSSESVINDSAKCLQALKSLLGDDELNVDKSCGFHVHLGLPNKSRKTKQWAAWMVTLGRLVEEAAFAAVPQSRRGNNYCRSFKTQLSSIKDIRYNKNKLSNDTRYYWINVVEMFRENGIKTVEIRLLGNTRRWTYCLAWISACHLMGQAAMRLITDPSGLSREVQKLQETFARIKSVYMDIIGDQLETAQELAYQAKIGPSLRTLYNEEYVARHLQYTTLEDKALMALDDGMSRLNQENVLQEITGTNERLAYQHVGHKRVAVCIVCYPFSDTKIRELTREVNPDGQGELCAV